MSGPDEVADHEDFAVDYGEGLLRLAQGLTGSSEGADELTDATLGRLWRERRRLPANEWPGWARGELARRWAKRREWPEPDDAGTAPHHAGPDTADIAADGTRLVRRRAVAGAASLGGVAAAGGAWLALRFAARGTPVTVGGVDLHVALQQDRRGERLVQVRHGDETVIEFAGHRDRPIVATAPLPDGRELVALWLRGEADGVDLIAAGGRVQPATIVEAGSGSVALAEREPTVEVPVAVWWSGQPQSLSRSEPHGAVQALAGPGVAGYFVPQSSVFVLTGPRREVVPPIVHDQARVFVADLGTSTKYPDGAQWLVVQSWSLVGAQIERGGRVIDAEVQVFQSGALVSVIVSPPLTADDPVLVTANGHQVRQTFRVPR